jgi:hypothetical protein
MDESIKIEEIEVEQAEELKVTQYKQNRSRPKAWASLIGGTIYMILLGSIYITGNITPYVASYYDIK